MANFSYFAPVPAAANGLLTLTNLDSSRMDWFASSGSYVESYFGSFNTRNGAVTGGVVTQVAGYDGSVMAWTATGLNLPAATVYNAILTGSGAQLVDLILGGADSIWGSIWGEAIYGGPGNDTVIALDGADSVAGGSGDDDINGNVGQDIVGGEAGDDWVRGGKDNDTISGGDGNDPHVNGNLGDDIVMGDAGNDTVYGGQGSDTLDGGTGNDLISGDLGNDVLFGSAGADRFVLRAGAGLDVVGDFNAAEGDRVVIAAGTSYNYGLVNGHLAYELDDGSRIVLYGVSDTGSATGWVVPV